MQNGVRPREFVFHRNYLLSLVISGILTHSGEFLSVPMMESLYIQPSCNGNWHTYSHTPSHNFHVIILAYCSICWLITLLYWTDFSIHRQKINLFKNSYMFYKYVFYLNISVLSPISYSFCFLFVVTSWTTVGLFIAHGMVSPLLLN